MHLAESISLVHNMVIYDVSYGQEALLQALVEWAEFHPDFLELLLRDNPETPDCPEVLITAALKVGKSAVAEQMFAMFQANSHVMAADIERLVDACIDECECHDDPGIMTAFRDSVYATVKRIADPEISCLFGEWDESISAHLEEYRHEQEELEDSSFVMNVKSMELVRLSDEQAAAPPSVDYDPSTGMASVVIPIEAETEEEALRMIAGNPSLRQRAMDATRAKLLDSPAEPSLPAEAKQEEAGLAEQKAPAARSEKQPREDAAEALLDDTIYDVCGVLYPDGMRVYSYLVGGLDVEIGDEVIVPVRSHTELKGTIVSLIRCKRIAAPYPIDKMKKILRKAETEE